jgi:hypothetical protein
VCSIKDYTESVKCDSCGGKQVYRLYIEDLSSLNMSVKKHSSELKTIGDLANRNRDSLSDDHKAALEYKHNSYKEEKSTKELPNGMSRIEKPKTKTKWNNSK